MYSIKTIADCSLCTVLLLLDYAEHRRTLEKVTKTYVSFSSSVISKHISLDKQVFSELRSRSTPELLWFLMKSVH
jgi:hypothetical protein